MQSMMRLKIQSKKFITLLKTLFFNQRKIILSFQKLLINLKLRIQNSQYLNFRQLKIQFKN